MRPVQPPNPNTRKPKLVAPPGACDTHLHVYGPFDRYPLVAERNYDPDPHSTLDDYLKVHRALGLERAVIVTGSGNGTNNQITLDALQQMKGSFKGLALLDPAITDAELMQLKIGGFTGFRIKANGRGGLSFEDTKRMITRTAGFGWHIEFMSQSMAEVVGAVPFLNSLNVPYAFDHVAHSEPHQNKNDREFRELIAILKNENHAWINLYSFYQLSESSPPDYSDMVDVVRLIIEIRPDRVIWGSNWPHGGIAVPMPNDGDLLDFLLAAAPDDTIRKQILVDNPAKLYGWPIS
ncbi:MAG TPA: amidohydrolase family protein [Candidatus Binatia bacterium]|jgi:predicted TIM-barrel fold metal-dependent hydrolase|nr:amidohydrolase family protein [Candidatus Binatia bacterium]